MKHWVPLETGREIVDSTCSGASSRFHLSYGILVTFNKTSQDIMILKIDDALIIVD